MILYHTGKVEIRTQDIHYGRKNADFGWGFYLTPDPVNQSCVRPRNKDIPVCRIQMRVSLQTASSSIYSVQFFESCSKKLLRS